MGVGLVTSRGREKGKVVTQELAKFDFELRHVPGKRHIPADFLSQPFGVSQGKDDNEDMILLPARRFA